jgi:hypothetical protein
MGASVAPPGADVLSFALLGESYHGGKHTLSGYLNTISTATGERLPQKFHLSQNTFHL